jgi:putative Ca2+/H+ antiporter (TMEM165/GDT1 family)
MSFAEVVFLAFWAVLIAELVGDRSIYALASLALRFRWGVVFLGYTIANAVKMAVAAVLAHAITHFQSRWTYIISAVAFFVSAVLIWVDEPLETECVDAKRQAWPRAAVICFCSFFLTEWGDSGQIAAAALVLKSHLLLATWLGATLGIVFKGAAAMTLGLQIRNRLPVGTLRVLSSVSCSVLGLLAIAQAMRD